MKIEINGIKREAQIVQAPKGSFCIWKDAYFPFFPLFVALVEPTEIETEDDDFNILVCPIMDLNYGYASALICELKNEFGLHDLFTLLRGAAMEHIPFKEAVSSIIKDLEIHRSIILDVVLKYAKLVDEGVITQYSNTFEDMRSNLNTR